MSDIAVSVEGLGKRYRIAHQRDPYGRLTESLAGALRVPYDRLRGKPRDSVEWFWALRDVSFELRQGDVVGVIGRNGAGKSTLLKVLSRITEPTTGSARLCGRVGSLLEVGTGFHPELSGRENIFMSGAVLGMRRAEISRKFDEIVDFAGIEQFLDTPVKRYSSGMQVRLGFAVAAHMETEILIVDEVLAVGDSAFQKKSLTKMEGVSHQGRTVVFVSHNMPAVESLCTSGMLLHEGQIVAMGDAREVVEGYLTRNLEILQKDLPDRQDRQGTGQIRITAVEAELRTGNASRLVLRYAAEPGLRNVDVSVGLFTSRGEGALYLSSQLSGNAFAEFPASGAMVCQFDALGLLPGRYSANLYCTVSGQVADWIVDAATIDVAEGDYYGNGRLPPPGYGSVVMPYRWSIER
jgi:lipopolysaccharide transport system ATP-binding protein